MQHFDLIIIGGGSGGIGAALTAGRAGVRTLWIEKEDRLGGTGVHALVNVWQPGYSASALAPEVARRLIARGDGCYVASASDTPSGRPLYRHAPEVAYPGTLRRWQDRQAMVISPGFVYTPDAMDAVIREMAAETGVITLWTRAVFLDTHTIPADDGLRRIASVTVETPNGVTTVTANHFIDAGADIPLARRAGCGWLMGREAADEYGEASAPPTREFKLNGWTLCFLIAEGADRVVLPADGYGNDSDWAHIGALPRSGYYVNMCLQVTGEAGWAMGVEQARACLLGNIARRWPGVRAAYGLVGYGITSLASRIGVREGPRLRARYMLTEQDFHRGGFGAHHPDCVAFTDHALDRHAPDGGCAEATNGPLGIPFRCLQPREIDNLLVACRGAGFSSLAASAARLQRTMIELGEAAGHYVATGQVIARALPAYRDVE